MVLLEAMEKTNEAVDGENAGSASAMASAEQSLKFGIGSAFVRKRHCFLYHAAPACSQGRVPHPIR